MEYKVKKISESRDWYEILKKNKKGESLLVEFTYIYYDETNTLPKLWLRNGYTKKLITNCIHVNCYCTRPDRLCIEKYNPTIKLSDDKKRMVLNFDWLLDVNDENKEKLINKIYHDFMKGDN